MSRPPPFGFDFLLFSSIWFFSISPNAPSNQTLLSVSIEMIERRSSMKRTALSGNCIYKRVKEEREKPEGAKRDRKQHSAVVGIERDLVLHLIRSVWTNNIRMHRSFLSIQKVDFFIHPRGARQKLLPKEFIPFSIGPNNKGKRGG